MKLMTILGLLLSLNVFANDVCLNQAKYQAIRTYHAETGVVQGSDGITYQGQFLDQEGESLRYVVTIQDNNEDGEYWFVDYEVVMKLENKKCKKVSVRNAGSRE